MSEGWKVRLLTTLLLTALATTPARAQAPPSPGAALGELRVGEQTFLLKYAVALETDDVEGMRLSGTPKKSVLLDLSDVELPPDAVGNWSALSELARAGKARAVELQIDPANGQLYGGAVYYAISASEPPNVTLTIQGKSSGFQLQDLKITADEVTGTSLMTEPSDWPRLAENAPKSQFQYRATFRARLRHQPPVTALLTGAPARDSAPAKGLLAFYAACRKGDLSGVRALMTPRTRKSLEQQVRQVGLPAFRKSLRELVPPGNDPLKGLLRVVVRGDRATLVFRRGGGMEAQAVRKQDGRWLMDAP